MSVYYSHIIENVTGVTTGATSAGIDIRNAFAGCKFYNLYGYNTSPTGGNTAYGIKFSGVTPYWGNDALNAAILIDSIGKLSNAYFYGEAAFIGGGFTGNLHNILEPVVFGLPVLFGPKHSKFPEAQQFIDLGIAFQIQTSEGLEAGLSLIKTNKKELEKKCIDTIHLSSGAANKIVDFMYKNAT